MRFVFLHRPTKNTVVPLKQSSTVLQFVELIPSLEGVYIRAYLLGMHSITDKELPNSDEIASIIWIVAADILLARFAIL
jgi:hypothetical protein